MGSFSIDATNANFDEMYEVLKNAQYIANTCHCTVIVNTSVGAFEVKCHEEKEKKQDEKHSKNKS